MLAEVRRLGLQAPPESAAVIRADRLTIETIAVDHVAALDLAEATGLTAHDASYLWLARTLGAERVTWDRKLAAAST